MKTEAGHLRPYKLKDDTTKRQAERQRAVADPDLQIREGGRSPKKNFSALRVSFGRKIRRGSGPLP